MFLTVAVTMIASSCHPHGQMVWLKQQRRCWVGQHVEPRSNKHKQLRQCQRPHCSLKANALLHTADVQSTLANDSGTPLDTDTIAAIVTGMPHCITVASLKAFCLNKPPLFQNQLCCRIYRNKTFMHDKQGHAIIKDRAIMQ